MKLEKITAPSDEASVSGLAFEMLVGLWFMGRSNQYQDMRQWDTQLVDEAYQQLNSEELAFVSSRELTEALLDRLMLKARLYTAQQLEHHEQMWNNYHYRLTGPGFLVEEAKKRQAAAVDKRILRELYALLLESDVGKWKPNLVIGSPCFEMGGAYGDFVVDGALLDIKVAKVRMPKKAFWQLGDYFLRNWELQYPLHISELAIYWARQGILQQLAVPRYFIDYFTSFRKQHRKGCKEKRAEFADYLAQNYSDHARLRQQGRLRADS